ncbi:Xaa-Pro dipeptidyl-peptidase [Gemmatimonas sp.]|uniref:Xaa-Pro dipeptidyl-peptidase n=1 Tax=Gemmatimonas sp. TaxID=1962908 RepID=UPI0035698BF7
MSRRSVLACLRAPVALVAVLVARAALAQPPAKTVAPVFVNGMTQVVPEWRDSTTWIRHDLWVETDFDSDRDGRKDRVHVDVTRPAQTEGGGLKVPVLYGSSPYFAGTSRDDSNWNVQQELGDQPPTRRAMVAPVHQPNRRRISNALVNEWVPRGFAVVHSEATGTGLSQGCATVGDYPERAPMKFVIDWLNGRAKGYTTPAGGEEVRATGWSTGKVGMIGTSYEGTLPLAAATTGVKGLEVVVPVLPNTSYYLYYRSNGLVRSPGGYLGEDVDVLYDFVASGDPATRARCDVLWKSNVFAGPKGQDRVTGDFNDFWKKRDLLPYVKNIKAAVLLAHGLNDYNVTPAHSVRIYDEMRARGLPVGLYLHQGGHGGNPPADMLNRWFSHYLYGVNNGVPGDQSAYIVQDAAAQAPMAAVAATVAAGAPAPNLRLRATALPTPFATFPVPGTQTVTLHPTAGGRGIASLAFAPVATGAESLIDDVAFSGSALASAPSSANRLLYATPVLTDTVHISGTPRVTLRMAATVKAANLSVWLVMLPYDSARAGSQSYVGNVSHGWADLQNAKALKKGGNYASKNRGKALEAGEYREVTFDLEPTDEFIPAGKQLAVMIMSSDREFTLWPKAGAELTLDLAKSSFRIPVVGGVSALQKAGMR